MKTTESPPGNPSPKGEKENINHHAVFELFERVWLSPPMGHHGVLEWGMKRAWWAKGYVYAKRETLPQSSPIESEIEKAFDDYRPTTHDRSFDDYRAGYIAGIKRGQEIASIDRAVLDRLNEVPNDK